MTSKLNDDNRLSTTTENDMFQAEPFQTSHKKIFVQYDYRDTSGVLHSGSSDTVESALNRMEAFGCREGKTKIVIHELLF